MLRVDSGPNRLQALKSASLKRKLGSSTLPLTTSPDETYMALSSIDMSYGDGLRMLLSARSCTLVTAGRRTLVHVDRRAGRSMPWGMVVLPGEVGGHASFVIAGDLPQLPT